ncbi:hypothetical protein TNCV_4074291 [Trichonephila clavipes]|uniref:Uncharacterized protein n=1 Tax=Trichonephila clavipes TaxID=2585209 RepID=A0A8X6W9K9_TRICX|nr:hypothetical protein TNCV_4074291 [Trichonephila clavipes]
MQSSYYPRQQCRNPSGSPNIPSGWQVAHAGVFTQASSRRRLHAGVFTQASSRRRHTRKRHTRKRHTRSRHYAGVNTTCLTMSYRGRQNSSLQRARCTRVVNHTFEHHSGDSTF